MRRRFQPVLDSLCSRTTPSYVIPNMPPIAAPPENPPICDPMPPIVPESDPDQTGGTDDDAIVIILYPSVTTVVE